MIRRYLNTKLLIDIWEIADKEIFKEAFRKNCIAPIVTFFLLPDDTLGEYSGNSITVNMDLLCNFHKAPAESLNQIIEVLLHEMTHCYNDKILGRNDTTKKGYHTTMFKLQAEKRGLVCSYCDEKLGYSYSRLTKNAYTSILNRLSDYAWNSLTRYIPKEDYYLMGERDD